MRIGIDVRLWNETGVGRYIRNLVREIGHLDRENEYVLFARTQDQHDIETYLSLGPSLRIVTADIQWHTAAEQFLFPDIIQKEQIDLMHFPYFSVPVGYTKPYVVTIHDLIVDSFDTGRASTLPLPLYKAKRLAYKFVMRRALKHAKKIITVSQATKQQIVEHYHVPEDAIAVTYEGVEKIKQVATSTFGKNTSDYFLYVGNAYPHKNVEQLVNAFALVHEQQPDVSLLIVGKTDYFKERLQEKVKAQHLDEYISFLGFVPDEDLAYLYKHALACVIPSFMEGFGLPALEAMASNCLAVVSDIPVFREICGDAALYIDPHNAESLQAVLLEVAHNQWKYEKVKEKGKQQAMQFSWEKMAKETIALYKGIQK